LYNHDWFKKRKERRETEREKETKKERDISVTHFLILGEKFPHRYGRAGDSRRQPAA
jgi:hypothetical protein